MKSVKGYVTSNAFFVVTAPILMNYFFADSGKFLKVL
jgi:hypothetical protein